jgi:hypothetical protein
MPVLGGSPRRVTELTGWDGTWLPDGNFLIARNTSFSQFPQAQPVSSQLYPIIPIGSAGRQTDSGCVLLCRKLKEHTQSGNFLRAGAARTASFRN